MNSSRNRRNWLLVFLIPVIAVAIMIGLWPIGFVQQIENVTMDRRFRARANQDPPPSDKIAMVGIGEYSLKTLGRWQEWPRSYYGTFAQAINLREPKVLAFDIFFSEKSKEEEQDNNFAYEVEVIPGAITGTQIDTDSDDSSESIPQSIGKTAPFPQVFGDVYEILGGNEANTPIPSLAQGAWTGIVNCPPSKVDGMRRKIPVIGRIGENVYPSFVLQCLMRLEDATPEQVEIVLGKHIRVPSKAGEDWVIPIDKQGFMPINYRNLDNFKIFDFARVLESLITFQSDNSWPEQLPDIKGQVIIVGQAAVGLSDFGPTPLSAQEPLFKVQATALNNILQRDYLHHIPLPVVLSVWLVVAWLTLILLRNAPISVAIATPILIVVGIIALTFFVFATHSIVIPLVLPVFGFIFIHTVVIADRLHVESKKNKYIRSVFGSYVSPKVVDQIIESGEMPKLGGQETEITMFFSDIQGFSSFSEKLTPEQLVELMNEYLSAMTEILTGESGTLDKYIGDAIVGMFGAPLSSNSHAYDAVLATIAIQKRQAELRQTWKQSGNWPEIVHNMRTRIGLNTGAAVIGNMGSSKQFNYTMMGDNVNLAARCESGAKSYGVFTMITGETRNSAREVKDDIAYRYLDKIIVKGRTKPASMYEVVDFQSELSGKQRECLDIFSKGIACYLQQDWKSAIVLFEESSRVETYKPETHAGVESNPSLVMLKRCRSMQKEPPGDDWDGVYRMETK